MTVAHPYSLYCSVAFGKGYKLSAQTGYEAIWLSLFNAVDDQIFANFWLYRDGCGVAPYLSLTKRSKVAGDKKPRKKEFKVDLFEGAVLDRKCSKKNRAYGDLILQNLAHDGATLILSKRGRKLTAQVELTLPGDKEHEARVARVTTDALTVLHLSGKPAVQVGQWRKASKGESIYWIDRFAIETVP